MAERVVDELRPVLVRLGVDAALVSHARSSSVVARPELLRLERLDEADPPPRRLQVDLVPPEGDDGRAVHLARDALDELLDARHRVAVVGVRLVPLEHRELGLVLVRDALVAEVLADLVDALEPADDQPLEVELGGDAEVEVRFELVVVRHERLARSAPP